jgi:hypothetical protein
MMKLIKNLNAILAVLQSLLIIKKQSLELKNIVCIQKNESEDIPKVDKENTIVFTPESSKISELASDSIEMSGVQWKIYIGSNLIGKDKTAEYIKKASEPIMDAHAKERVAYYDFEKYKLKAKLYEPKTILAMIVPLSLVLCVLIYCVCCCRENNIHSNEIMIKNLQEISMKLDGINNTFKNNRDSTTSSINAMNVNVNNLNSSLQQINTSIANLKLTCSKQPYQQLPKISDCNTNIYNNCNK